MLCFKIFTIEGVWREVCATDLQVYFFILYILGMVGFFFTIFLLKKYRVL